MLIKIQIKFVKNWLLFLKVESDIIISTLPSNEKPRIQTGYEFVMKILFLDQT